MTVTIALHPEEYADIIKKFGRSIPVTSGYPQRLLDGLPAFVVDQGEDTYKNWTMIKAADCLHAGASKG